MRSDVRLCKDCAFYRKSGGWPSCTHPENVHRWFSLEDGEHVEREKCRPYRLREESWQCGPNAAWFKPRAWTRFVAWVKQAAQRRESA